MIREGRPDDYSAVRDLAKRSNFNHWASNSLDLWAEREGSIFLVAEADKKVVGFCLSRETAGESEILVLCVDESYREKGFGTELVSENIRRSKNNNVETIFLEVSVNNTVAVGIYERLGFSTVTTRKKYYNNREDAYLMRLDL